ncbi:hypothetical protein BsWGS_06432 [Bradybaena similaris]
MDQPGGEKHFVPEHGNVLEFSSPADRATNRRNKCRRRRIPLLLAARIERLRDQMSQYQQKRQACGMCSQGDLTDQQTNNPYTMESYGKFGMPWINPFIMMGSNQGEPCKTHGGNMVNPYYVPIMPMDDHSCSYAHAAPHDNAASNAHAVPHHGALNSQPSCYVHTCCQTDPDMQESQSHMDMMPNQGQRSITIQSLHGQGDQHAHSAGHRISICLPQVCPHQSSGGYGSQSSPHMMPEAHDVPQHPMALTSTQQNPHEAGDNILQTSSSYPSVQMGKEIIKETETEEKELEQCEADSDLQALLDEKKEPVEELMKEGEKLSKQQLQCTIIKQLRAKVKENETTIAAQKERLDEQTKQLKRLFTALDSKEEMQDKQDETLYQLRKDIQRQEKELIIYKSDFEHAQEKVRNLQNALENAYKELADLHHSNASLYSKAQKAEMYVREELEATMEREQQRFIQEREGFVMQIEDLRIEIDDLRHEMARLKKEASRREGLLRDEMAHLQEHLQQDEVKSPDVTHSETSAMLPLLRQIENLQATLGAQSVAWERVEKNLTDRLAKSALEIAQEKERTANDHLMELSARVASLEAANNQEKAQLAPEVESDRPKPEELKDFGSRYRR